MGERDISENAKLEICNLPLPGWKIDNVHQPSIVMRCHFYSFSAPIVVKKRGRPAGPPKPPKEKKPRGRPKGEGPRAPKPTHAPFVKLVEQAIESLYERKGVSKQAIVRYIMSKEPVSVVHFFL